MTYRMFIDDERMPPDDGNHWVICRDITDVISHILACGFPSFISFDHDLGEDTSNGKEIADYLIAWDIGHEEQFMPKDFSFYVHSQNPVGAENIRALLTNYLEFKEKNK